jgi:hypothetical protein
MADLKFEAFGSIENIGKLSMTITQKLHGTNALVYIFEKDGVKDIMCGCRTRWITPEQDNYGFAEYVMSNKTEFIEKLGIGRHFGEWIGRGINNGEGLGKERRFALFNWYKFKDQPLPPFTTTVPVLYQGRVDLDKINEVMEELKTTGSKLVQGFMNPEGVVVQIGNQRFKKVFTPEETKWTKTKDKIKNSPAVDYSYLLQPIRLEKLLSKDEQYLKNYPESLPIIVKEYINDLIKEDQFKDLDEKYIKKSSSDIFNFIKSFINNLF